MTVQALLDEVSREVGIIRRAREKYAKQLAPDFSTFAYLPPSEMGLSRIIASLLDPKGYHAQGDVFLGAFLKLFLPEKYDLKLYAGMLSRAEVLTENRTTHIANTNRRIDITIELANLLIGIENKPWAGDQEDQLNDYAKNLTRWAGDKSWLLIYLSGYPASPGENSIPTKIWQKLCEDGHAFEITYGCLIPWLNRCIGICQPSHVLNFLRELRNYIRREFEGIRDMTETQATIDKICENKDNFDAALQVSAAFEDAKNSLLHKLQTQLDGLTKKRDWFLDWQVDGKQYSTIWIRFFEEEQDYCACFEFWLGGLQSLVYGICKTPKKLAEDEDEIRSDLTDLLKAQMGGASNWPWWAWCSVYHEGYIDWRSSVQPWLGIIDDDQSLAKRMIESIDKIYDALEKGGKLESLLRP